jgi:hypothetical protein
MRAVNAFYNVDRHINGALLTLIPKKPDAMTPSEYRPISLIHSFPKMIAKMLANRLALRLDVLVQKNPSAFIKGRSILDNFKYVQSATKLLKKRKVPKLLLKLDISKADGEIGWPFCSPRLPPRSSSTANLANASSTTGAYGKATRSPP